METKKYKTLVLSDLGDSTGNILKNTAHLAKMIGGDIGFFHVKQPSKVVKQDNQLSAIRSINASYVSTKKEIEQLVGPISESYHQKIDPVVVLGNVKEEINKQIQSFQPDIIVLGQRKQVPFKLLGDSITQHVLSNFDGPVMIASHDKVLEQDQELSLGLFNDTWECLKTALAEELLEHSNQPLKSFRIANGHFRSEEIDLDKKIVEYNFSTSDNALKNISKYLSKIKVDVLFVNREKTGQDKTNINDVIGTFNVPLLLTGGPNFKIQ